MQNKNLLVFLDKLSVIKVFCLKDKNILYINMNKIIKIKNFTKSKIIV